MLKALICKLWLNEDMVEKIFAYYKERLSKKVKKKETKIENVDYVNWRNGGYPPKHSSPSSSSISYASSSSNRSSFH